MLNGTENNVHQGGNELFEKEKIVSNPALYSPLTLALVGDAVYELYVRTRLLENENALAHKVHKRAIAYVCASGQAESVKKIIDLLTEAEEAVYKRGRNAKSPTVPKNADVGEYRCATGFEALMGYLYLGGEHERLNEVMSASFDAVSEKIKNKKISGISGN